jgi:hypothetical protein
MILFTKLVRHQKQKYFIYFSDEKNTSLALD